MQYFYDGQIRRYVGQMIRMLSGFKYQTEDGKQTTVPVMYGDMTRQAANIIRENSENKIPSAPRIAVYITGIALDKTRISDQTFVSKVHIRERTKVYDGSGNVVDYETTQGNHYTVERLMPTPYKLTVKADIWATNTNMKLQIMEQIMMLFNPSVEIQTTDNYIDWTSLTVVELTEVTFTSRQIPQGIDSEIDIATLQFEAPIWINPPTKVKRLGVIHDIIMNIHDQSYSFETDEKVSIKDFDIFVYYDTGAGQYYAELLDVKSIIQSLPDDQQTAWNKIGQDINWSTLLDMYPNKFKAGSSQLFLKQTSGNEIIGTVAVNTLDETKLIINFDQDTYPTNTPIEGDTSGILRGTVDAIINPETFNPGTITGNPRYLLLNDVGTNTAAWSTLVAKANDIIEWTGVAWEVILDAANISETVYTTNIRTGVQYKYEAGEWTRAFEGEYRKGNWQLVL